MNVKALQFYEILRSKHGCIMMGEHQAGKSTLVRLLQNALNRASLNEFMLAVQDLRKSKMGRLCKAYEAEQIAEQTEIAVREARNAMHGDFASASKRRVKKGDKELQQKMTLEAYKDLWRQSAPTAAEL
jgi:predicted ATP-binding protein involved in virulence